MIPPDVKNAVATQKIQIRLAIHVVEIRPFGPRIDFVEPDYPLRRHQYTVHMPFVELVIFTQPRRHDFL